VTGKIAAIGWDVTGGQKYWYLTLVGQPGHVYVGTVSSAGPALVLAQVGDQVTISVLTVGAQESTRTMQSFTDARIPLNAPGT
jgi:D-arabinose 1-dehydrogenase-like Zn-dependent alcohol dehydrogenase